MGSRRKEEYQLSRSLPVCNVPSLHPRVDLVDSCSLPHPWTVPSPSITPTLIWSAFFYRSFHLMHLSPAVRSLLTLILIQDIIVGEAELTSSPEEPVDEGEEGSDEDPGNMLLRAAKVLAAGGGSGGHSVKAEAADCAGGPAAVDGPPGGSSPGEGKRKRRSLGTALVGSTGGTCDTCGTGGPAGGMGGLLDDAAEIDTTKQSFADVLLGASGELSGGGTAGGSSDEDNNEEGSMIIISEAAFGRTGAPHE